MPSEILNWQAFRCRVFFRLHRAGHDLHSQLLAEILSNPNHYEILNGSREELEVESAPVMLSGLLAVSC